MAIHRFLKHLGFVCKNVLTIDSKPCYYYYDDEFRVQVQEDTFFVTDKGHIVDTCPVNPLTQFREVVECLRRLEHAGALNYHRYRMFNLLIEA